MVHLWDAAKNAKEEGKRKLQPQKAHKGGNGRDY